MAQQKLIGARSHGRTPPGTPTISQRRTAARLAGERAFDPGVECVNGHMSLRWTNNGICIECKRARDNAYNAAHKEEHRARSRRSALNRRPAVRDYLHEYYARNGRAIRARVKQWAKDNPGRVVEQRSARRARLVGAQTGCRRAYAANADALRRAESIPCYWCGRKTKRSARHLDHIIPLSRGGADAVANICVACPRCNQTKHAKMPEDFSGQSEMRLA